MIGIIRNNEEAIRVWHSYALKKKSISMKCMPNLKKTNKKIYLFN